MIEEHSVFDLSCCPHCGERTGFDYILTMKGIQFQPWKGVDIDPWFESSVGNSSQHGAYRCVDCNKIIK